MHASIASDYTFSSSLHITFRRYITFAHPDLRRGWRGFCHRGVFEKFLFSYLMIAPQSRIFLAIINLAFTTL